jgi:hypothetical protein
MTDELTDKKIMLPDLISWAAFLKGSVALQKEKVM